MSGPDKGGRPPNLNRQARALLRRHGQRWLDEARRQADLGDLSAVRLVLELAHPGSARHGHEAETA